jgi:hypothetical protein
MDTENRTGVWVHGWGEMSHEEWDQMKPQQNATLVAEHPSGGRLFVGSTPYSEDLWQNPNPPERSRVYHRDLIDQRYAFYVHSPAADVGVVDTRYPMPDGRLSADTKDILRRLAVTAAQDFANGLRIASVCQAGINRSSLFAALVLIETGEYTGKEAIDLIRTERSIICLANEHFVEWILEYEPSGINA